MQAKEFITWKSIYETNIPKIDDQHKRLLVILNDLYRSFIQKDGSDVMLDIAKKLISYTKYHFTAEETFLSKINYPKLQEQIDEHIGFKTKIDEFYINIEKVGMSVEILQFLQNWLKSHIKGKDVAYSQWIFENKIDFEKFI